MMFCPMTFAGSQAGYNFQVLRSECKFSERRVMIIGERRRSQER